MKLVLFLIFAFSSWVSAGVRIVGNGGDVVVCKDDDGLIQRIELLDHFEAENYRGQTIDLGPESLAVEEMIQVALHRLQRLSPDRAELYGQWIEEFHNEAQFRSDLDLVDIPDSDHSVLPKGCEIKQIANQTTLLLPGQKRYTIDDNLWRLLTNEQKAGLILHEVVYREALSLNHENSVAARFFAALMASPTLEALNLEEFMGILRTLGFQQLQVQGALIDLREGAYSFYNQNLLKSATVIAGSEILDARTQRKFSARHEVKFNSRGEVEVFYLSKVYSWEDELYQLSLAPQVVNLHGNGRLALAVLDSPHEIEFGDFQVLATGHLELYESGLPKRVKIERGTWRGVRISSNIGVFPNGGPQFINLVDLLPIKLQGQTLPIQGLARFFESGELNEIVLGQGALLLTSSGKRKSITAGTRLILDRHGIVQE